MGLELVDMFRHGISWLLMGLIVVQSVNTAVLHYLRKDLSRFAELFEAFRGACQDRHTIVDREITECKQQIGRLQGRFNGYKNVGTPD